MAVVSVKQILESGAHYGHLARRWHPKMARYIYGLKHGVHIIDLQQTLRQLKRAYLFVRDLSAKGNMVLFAATKRQAREVIQEEATRCGAYYINGRWLGGLLTNFQTVRGSISTLKRIEEHRGEDGLYEGMIKKEAGLMEKSRLKLEQALGGIKEMKRLPGALFVIDCNKEHLALKEARKLHMPIIAVVDTNCDPSHVDYVIPGNDDSIRSIRLFSAVMASAVLEGKAIYEARRSEIVAANKVRNAGHKARKPRDGKPASRKAPDKAVQKAPNPLPAKAAMPSVNPSMPSVNPSMPSVNPSMPSVNPSMPSVNPSMPSVNPSMPSVNPSTDPAKTPAPSDAGVQVSVSAKTVMSLRAATGAGVMECKAALQEVNGDIEAAKKHLRVKGVAIAQKKAGREANEGAIAIVFSEDKSKASMVRMACETDFVARNAQFQGLLQRVTKQVLAQGPQDVLTQKPVEGEGETMEAVLTEGIQAMGENLRIEESVCVFAKAHNVLGGYVHTNHKVAVLVRLEAQTQQQPKALEDLVRDLAMHAAAMPVLAIEEQGLGSDVLAKEKAIAEAQFDALGKPENLKEKIVQGRMRKFVQESTLLGQTFVKDPKKTISTLLQEAEKTQGGLVKVVQLIKYQV